MALRYQVIITLDAQQCIQDIIDYLIVKFSQETAIRINQVIVDAIMDLKTFPERNDVAENISKRGVIYRRIMVKSYRIVYTVDKENEQVIVVDVDYGPRSQDRLVHKFG